MDPAGISDGGQLALLPGLLGAAAGLYVGWIDYRLALGAFRGWQARNEGKPLGPFGTWLLGNGRLIEGVLFVSLMSGIPAIGFLAGAMLGS